MHTMIDEIRQHYPHVKALYARQQNTPLFEYYRNDITARTLSRVASADKSVVSILVGVALQQQFIHSVDQTIEDVADWDKTTNIAPEMRKITLRHLLTMTSGIHWPPPRSSFAPQHDDIRILEELSMVEPPGTTFAYKPDVHLMVRLVEEASGMTLNQFSERYLFTILGIERYAWDVAFTGYEGLSLTIRDFWKLGQLYLQQGMWEGTQVVPADYIETSTSPLVTGDFPEHDQYGYYWWVTSVADHPVFYAGGFGGQYLVVLPDLELVFAMQSELDRPHQENKALLFNYIEERACQ